MNSDEDETHAAPDDFYMAARCVSCSTTTLPEQLYVCSSCGGDLCEACELEHPGECDYRVDAEPASSSTGPSVPLPDSQLYRPCSKTLPCRLCLDNGVPESQATHRCDRGESHRVSHRFTCPNHGVYRYPTDAELGAMLLTPSKGCSMPFGHILSLLWNWLIRMVRRPALRSSRRDASTSYDPPPVMRDAETWYSCWCCRRAQWSWCSLCGLPVCERHAWCYQCREWHCWRCCPWRKEWGLMVLQPEGDTFPVGRVK